MLSLISDGHVLVDVLHTCHDNCYRVCLINDDDDDDDDDCFYDWVAIGKFTLTVSTTQQNGQLLLPKVVISGIDSTESKRIAALSLKGAFTSTMSY